MTIVHDAINEAIPFDLEIEGEGRVPIIVTFNYTGAIENWTVPAGVTSLTIEVWGAQGARGNGGKGAMMKGDFVVSPGDEIKVLVGQKGFDGDNTRVYLGGGGGGGSFVCKSNNDPMIISGGGGGYTNTGSTATMQGRATTDGGDTYSNGGGNNGQGGRNGMTNGQAAGGGGLLTDGENYSSYCYGGKSFLNGGAGGNGTTGYTGGNGGFGGGGGGYCRSNIYNRSGGGGGYSGGQGSTWSGQQSGGGGGSINNGSNKTATPGVKTNNGEVKITY
ncbi:MAG: hypothetical protein K8S87_01070 [Planctomycetes bacterium]|nr:hypothetical protein [Planctomycetota bacterium]